MFYITALFLIWTLVEASQNYKIPTDHCNIGWPNEYIGDGACDLECMTMAWLYDGAMMVVGDLIVLKTDGTKSDCWDDWQDTGCDIRDLWNSICDTKCNKNAWGWDLGDCGWCGSRCTETKLGDGNWQTVWNSDMCNWDNGDWAYWAVGCSVAMLDGDCDNACNTENWDWDNGACQNTQCAPGCITGQIDNQECESECYIEECSWDGMDCGICAPMCPIRDQFNDTSEDAWCNQACNWDGGSCGICAAGCSADNLINGTWDQDCNVSDCDYDMGQWGCESECLKSMNQNGTCDTEWLTPNCLYDFSFGSRFDDTYGPDDRNFVFDETRRDCNIDQVKIAIAYQIIKNNFRARWDESKCPCKLSTLLNDECDIGCNTEECVYDMGRCWVEMQIVEALAAGTITGCQIGEPDPTSSTDLPKCQPDAIWAQYMYCAYCYDDGCLSCKIFGGQDGTGTGHNPLDGSNDHVQLYNECHVSCPFILKKHPYIDQLCSTAEVDSEALPNSPFSVIVAVTSNNDVEQLGTEESPYTQLSGALGSIWGLNVRVSLLQGTHVFDELNSLDYVDAFASTTKTSPLFSTVTKNTKELTITSFLCDQAVDPSHPNIIGKCINDVDNDERPTISITEYQMTLLIQYKTTISNINITSDKLLNSACDRDSCTYCPNIERIGSSEGIDDKDQDIAQDDLQYYPVTTLWAENNGINFIEVQSGWPLTLENVTFSKFQVGYNSIIKLLGNSSLHMYNVRFYRVQVEDDPNMTMQIAVILTEAWNEAVTGATYAYECATIKYEGGSVELLNYGYEYSSSLTQSGFIAGHQLAELEIKDVTFTYNVIWNADARSLIYLADFLKFSLINCTFQYNVAKSHAILYIANQLDEFKENYVNGQSVDENTTHISIDNWTFEHNGSDIGSMIYVSFLNTIQNILISNSIFTENITLTEPLLDFVYEGEITPEMTDGGTTQQTVLGEKVQITINKMSFVLLNNEITDNTMGENGMLRIVGFTNLDIDNVNIQQNLDNTFQVVVERKIAEKVLSYHVSHPQAYITQGYTQVIAANVWVRNVSLQNNVGTTVQNSSFIDNKCSTDATVEQQSPALIILSTASRDVIKIQDTEFRSNVGSNVASAIFILANSDVVLSGLYVKTNQSELYGALYLQNGDAQTYEITNSTFDGNDGRSGGAIYTIVSTLQIRSWTFKNSKADLTGGAINFTQITNQNGIISITGSTFTKNHSLLSGAIYIDNKSIMGKTQFDIQSSTFEENTAEFGSIIGVSGTVFLRESQNSNIIDSTFTRNEAKTASGIIIRALDGNIVINNCKFEENKGSFGAALALESTANTSISNSEFKKNSGNSIISIDNSLQMQNIVMTSLTFEDNEGVVVYASTASITETGNTYTGNSHAVGSWLLLDDGIVQATNNEYQNNIASGQGGAIFIRTLSDYSCEYCSIHSNTAENGGFLYGEIKSKVDIKHSRISKNTASNNGSVLYLLSCQTSSQFVNDTIYENEVNSSGTIYLLESWLDISDTIFHDNTQTTEGSTPGIHAIISELTISNSQFYNLKSHDGGSVFHISSDSNLLVNQTSISNCETEMEGGVLFCLQSAASFYNCNIQEIKAEDSAFALANQQSNITISHCEMSQIKAHGNSLINAQKGQIKIYDSTFDDFNNTGIAGNDLKILYISNSQFSNQTSIANWGGVVFWDKWDDIQIYNSKFSNSSSPEGGAIYIIGRKSDPVDTVFQIKHNEFHLNQANQGGAIWADNSHIDIQNNIFTNNTAGFLTQEQGFYEYEDSGGAIRIQCTDQYKCTYNVADNTFMGNRGLNSGGAVSWDGNEPKGLKENNYTSNEAAYGGSIASYASALVSVDENGVPINRGRSLNDEFLTNMTSVVSGQSSGLVIRAALTDGNGEIIRNDNTSTALLFSKSAGISLSGVLQVSAIKGIFVFNDFKITAAPGDSVVIQIQTAAINTAKENVSTNEFAIAADLRKCVLGEVQIANACEECDEGKYSLSADDEVCRVCPDNAYCSGGYTIIPDGGFWRPHHLYDGVFECPNFDAWMGSEQLDVQNGNYSLTGECATGYAGNMWQSCDIDYARSGADNWLKCLDDEVNIVRLILVSIAMVAVVGVMVRSTMISAYRPKKKHSVYIKILLNWLQLVILIENFNLSWPSAVVEMRNVKESAGDVGNHVISFDCFFGEEGDDTGIQIYFDKLIIWAILPIVIIAANFIFWAIVSCFKGSKKYLNQQGMTTLVILYFLIHPNLVKNFFFALSCREIEKDQMWLIANLDVRCWQGDHAYYLLTVIIPSVIVWGCGMPFLFLYILYKRRNSLHTYHAKAQYGFLYNGYELNRFFWEFVILYRKILIVIILIFFTQHSTTVAALCCLFVLLMSLHLQNQVKPFNLPEYNSMELRSIMVATVTLYCGLFYLSGDIDEVTKYLLLVLMIGFNLYFLIYWCYKMAGAGLTLVLESVSCIRKCLGRKHVQDGYGDIMVGYGFQNSHIRHQGNVQVFSMVKNSDPETPYDKTVKIPNTMEDLAIAQLQQRRHRIPITGLTDVSELDYDEYKACVMPDSEESVNTKCISSENPEDEAIVEQNS